MTPKEELRERVVERAAEKIAAEARGIVAERIYPPAEAAELLGFRGVRAGKSIREIPTLLLPRIPITPGGRIVGYLGRDMIRFLEERRATVLKPHMRAG